MFLKHSLVDIKNFTVEYDKKYVKEISFNQTTDRDGISTFNVLIDSRYVITKMIWFLRVRIPADRTDVEFKREFFRVAVDVQKLLSGDANFLVKMIAKFIVESFDRKVEFPLAKVRPNCVCVNC
jgi:hypothetical protein